MRALATQELQVMRYLLEAQLTFAILPDLTPEQDTRFARAIQEAVKTINDRAGLAPLTFAQDDPAGTASAAHGNTAAPLSRKEP